MAWLAGYAARKRIPLKGVVGSGVDYQLPFLVFNKTAPILSGYSHRILCLINGDNIDEDLVDFPVLVKLDSSNFNFSLANADGYDVRFTQADGVTLLKYERELHDSAGQTAYYWVKIPYIGRRTGASFYIYFRTTDTADGADPTNVWDANYKAVYHMSDLTTSTVKDSTSNGLNGNKTAANQPIESATAKINKSQDFTPNEFINVGATGIVGSWTADIWVYQDANGWYYPLNLAASIGIGLNTGVSNWFFYDGTNVRMGTTAPAALTWTKLTVSFNSATNKIQLYRDGVAEGALQDVNDVDIGDLELGRRNDNLAYLNGKMDEVRISSSLRSAAWVKASYYSETNGLVTIGETISLIDLENHSLSFPNDIRFTAADETTLLSHWLENLEAYAYNSGIKFAKVWVKVSANLDADQEIYLYFGKAGDSSASDDNATFIAGADFDDGTTTGLTINTAGAGAATVENPTKLHGVLSADYVKKNIRNPVLGIGASGAWDEQHVRDLAPVIDGNNRLVVETTNPSDNGHIVAYYYGTDTSDETTQARKIGRATSQDGGRTWTKYSGNPVLQGTGVIGDWDRYGAQSPAVMYLPGVGPDVTKPYKMFYGGRPTMLANGQVDIGLAESADGLTWTRYAGNPVLSINQFNNIRSLVVPWIIKNSAGTYVLIAEALTSAGHAHGDIKWIIIGATSPDLVNWTPMNQSGGKGDEILAWGAPGTWDDNSVANPKIIELTGANAGKYIMMYNGQPSGDHWESGFATTTDVPANWTTASWTKYANNPVQKESGVSSRPDMWAVECSALVIDDVESSCSEVRVWWQSMNNDPSLVYNTTICMSLMPQGRILHAKGAANADAWIVGKNLGAVGNFMLDILVDDNIRDAAGSVSDNNLCGLIDNAGVPACAAAAVINPMLRFIGARLPLVSGQANSSKWFIIYYDGSGTPNYWNGTAWAAGATYFGTHGICRLRIWDDGTNYKCDIVDVVRGVSILPSGPASIAKGSVKAFANGRTLIVSEPYTDFYYQGFDFDNWIIRKYVAPEPGSWDGPDPPSIPGLKFGGAAAKLLAGRLI